MSTPRQDDPDIKMFEELETPVNLRDYALEDYLVFVIFWALSGVVFAQFFSRYVLNASIFWTEELARYLLISVAFLGSVMAVRKNSHIFVEFFYRYLPHWLGRVLVTLVDLIRIIFFGLGTYLTWRLIPLMQNQRMASIDIPMSYMYYVVLAGFTLMALRSVQILWTHWRTNYVPLIEEDKPTSPTTQGT